MMAALGAEVVLVDQLPESKPGYVSGGDLELVERRTAEIVTERGGFRADQFHPESNFREHYLHTGPEILAQTGGALDAFCDFAGTGGTLAGCAAAFKEVDPLLRRRARGRGGAGGRRDHRSPPPYPGRRLRFCGAAAACGAS